MIVFGDHNIVIYLLLPVFNLEDCNLWGQFGLWIYLELVYLTLSLIHHGYGLELGVKSQHYWDALVEALESSLSSLPSPIIQHISEGRVTALARDVAGNIGTVGGFIEVLQDLIDYLVILYHLLLVSGDSVEEKFEFLKSMRLLIIRERIIIFECCKYTRDLHYSRQQMCRQEPSTELSCRLWRYPIDYIIQGNVFNVILLLINFLFLKPLRLRNF